MVCVFKTNQKAGKGCRCSSHYDLWVSSSGLLMIGSALLGNSQNSESACSNVEAPLTSELCWGSLAKLLYKEYAQGFT